MQKELRLLIRLARQEMDERRFEMVQAVASRAEAEAALDTHAEQFARETQAPANDPVALMTFGAWRRHAIDVRNGLRAQRDIRVDEEAAALESVREAFTDLKRLEVARDQVQRDARLQAVRHADRMADDAQALVPLDVAA